MRTGDFAKKYCLSPNGVRYYVEQGLISPGIKNGQYDFDSNCIFDMDKIVRLKQMHFSLNEINKIFHLLRLAQYSNNQESHQIFMDIFVNKKEELHKEILLIEESIEQIENYILHNDYIREKGDESGIPIKCIDLLVCPKCKGSLSFLNTEIFKNQILAGQIRCECGYEARINNGILVGTQNSKLNMEWCYLENLISEHSLDYIKLETKAYYKVKEMFKGILKQTDLVIISSGGYAGGFICTYSDLFSEDTTFIIVDQYLDTLAHIKEQLGVLNTKFNILYLCDENFNFPLRDNSIDIFLDDFSSSEYIFYNSSYPADKISSLLNDKHYVGGAFSYYQKNAKTLKQITAEYPNADENLFTLSAFKSHLNRKGIKIMKDGVIGSVQNPGIGHSFPYHNPMDKLGIYTYLGVKNSTLSE